MNTLSEKVAALPPDLRREVEDFVEFLLEKHRKLVLGGADEAAFWQVTSQPALDQVWDNDEDDVYAGLLET